MDDGFTNLLALLQSSAVDETHVESLGLPPDAIGHLYSGLVENYARRQWSSQTTLSMVLERYRLIYPSCAAFCQAHRDDVLAFFHHVEDRRNQQDQLFMDVDMRSHHVCHLVKTQSTDPRRTLLPLTDAQMAQWILSTLPQAVVWVCARHIKMYDKSARAKVKDGFFTPFLSLPEHTFVLESYPLVLINMLLCCLHHLADEDGGPHANHGLLVGGGSVQKTIHYGWVANCVKNLPHPACDGTKGFPYVPKHILYHALRNTPHIHTLRSPGNIQYWPYAHVPPFKHTIFTLPREEPLPPDFRLPEKDMQCHETLASIQEDTVDPSPRPLPEDEHDSWTRMDTETVDADPDTVDADTDPDPETFLGIDPGSKAFKCMRGTVVGAHVLEVSHYPSAEPRFDALQHTASSFFLNVRALQQDHAAWALAQACHGMHPRSFLAANVAPENSTFAKAVQALAPYVHRYAGVHSRKELDMTKYVEIKEPKAFCMAADGSLDNDENESMDNDNRVFAVPLWIVTQHVEWDDEAKFLAELQQRAGFIKNREPFYALRLPEDHGEPPVHLSAYFAWALYVFSWFQNFAAAPSPHPTTASVLVPNVMNKMEMAYTEYTMKAALGPVGISNIVVLTEGNAETVANRMTTSLSVENPAAPRGLSLGLVAGGCTGDVNLTELDTDTGRMRCIFKSTHLLHDASSIHLNRRLARRILGEELCDRRALAEHYDDMVEQGRYGIHTCREARLLVFQYVTELVDALKHEIETNHKYDILHHVPGAAYHLRKDVYGFCLDVKISLADVYVPELLVSINHTVDHAVEVLRHFYRQYPDKPPITQLSFSGGVFHSAVGATLAHRQLLDRLDHMDLAGPPGLRDRLQAPSFTKTHFGAGCMGSLGTLMALRRQETQHVIRRVKYERADTSETLSCPSLHTADLGNHWEFDLCTRGFPRTTKVQVNQEVILPCASVDGVVFLHVMALKYGGELVFCDTNKYYFADEVRGETLVCGGFDTILRSRAFAPRDGSEGGDNNNNEDNDMIDHVKVTCRLLAMRRQLEITIVPVRRQVTNHDDDVDVHHVPMYITYSFPGCCNQWRLAAKLCFLSHVGHGNLAKGIFHYERLLYLTVHVLNNAKYKGVDRRFLDAMWQFNQWILQDVSVAHLHHFCRRFQEPWQQDYHAKELRLDDHPARVYTTMSSDDWEKTILYATAQEADIASMNLDGDTEQNTLNKKRKVAIA